MTVMGIKAVTYLMAFLYSNLLLHKQEKDACLLADREPDQYYVESYIDLCFTDKNGKIISIEAIEIRIFKRNFWGKFREIKEFPNSNTYIKFREDNSVRIFFPIRSLNNVPVVTPTVFFSVNNGIKNKLSVKFKNRKRSILFRKDNSNPIEPVIRKEIRLNDSTIIWQFSDENLKPVCLILDGKGLCLLN